MSRIGKKPIPIPKGVTVQIAADAIEVQGPKGKLRQYIPPGVVFAEDDGSLVAKTAREEPGLGKFHGLARSLVANAVIGVTAGFKKELDIVGIGYRAELKAGRSRSRWATRIRSCSTSPLGSRSRSTSRRTSP